MAKKDGGLIGPLKPGKPRRSKLGPKERGKSKTSRAGNGAKIR